MKSTLIFLFISLNLHVFAQLEEGFNKEEARDMIAICNSFTFLELYNSDVNILPPGYEKRYTSGVFGMDNKFQIYQKGDVVVINLRGSTDKQVSWLENIYSAMIPAKGVIKVSGENIQYTFAKGPAAAVHSGYALAVAFLAKDLLYHISVLNREGLHHFIITGHSQGGALANMLRAYLENLPASEINKKNKFKTYAFAAPKVGNKEFAEEYNNAFNVTKSTFNVVNQADPIPTFPMSYKEGSSYFTDNLETLLFDRESFSIKDMASDGAALLFEKKLISLTQRVGKSTAGQISKDVGPIVMPPYVQDINYQELSPRMQIDPVSYPYVLKDSTILKNDSLMAIYKKGNDGQFLNKTLYQKQPWTYQHKPYNYYVSFLKMYFPNEYRLLRKKYLYENL